MAGQKRAVAKGFLYRPGVPGKFHFRIRERHIAETYVPLLASKKVGAVKLDLALRGIALLPAHTGRRSAGVVLPRVSYEQLHDLCRVGSRYLMTTPEDEIHDPAVLAVKRNWVGRNLAILEEVGAVERSESHRGRPGIVVRRDHGDGPFDDPDGSPGNSYITISGPVLARWLHVWETPEVAAYLAAMVADRYARLKAPDGTVAVGGATWFEALDWFADPNRYRPAGHVRVDFAVRTLERGLARLRDDGLVTWTHSSRRPDQPSRRFRSGRRNIYTNHFADVDAAAEATATSTSLDALLAEKTEPRGWPKPPDRGLRPSPYLPPDTMTMPPPNPPSISAADLETLISPERFATYLRARPDPDEAVHLYEWNARISGAFAELLHHVEILVRNAMHDSLTAHHATIPGRPPGTAWFDPPSWVRHHWFNTPALDSINKAVRAAGHSPARPRPGKVVAELNFGFWRYLTSDRYEQSLWDPALDHAFAAPGARPRDRRRAVEDHLGPLHLLRNRIAHCEPVFGTITYRRRRVAPVTKRLEDLHADALGLASWIAPPAEPWLQTTVSQIPGLLANRP